MAPNDYIEIWVTHDKNNSSAIAETMQVTAEAIQGAGVSGYSGTQGASGISGFSGIATIFGDQFTETSVDDPTTTTSTTNQTRLTLNFTPSVTGNYLVNYSAEIGNTVSGRTTGISFFRDSTLIAGEQLYDAGVNYYIAAATGSKVESLIGGTLYVYTIKYRAIQSTATIQNARLQIWRVT
jgi:hypothetical protein